METYILLPESQYKKCFPEESDSDLDTPEEMVGSTTTSVVPEVKPIDSSTDEVIRIPKREHSPSDDKNSNKKMKPNAGEKRQIGDQFGLPISKRLKTNTTDFSDQGFNNTLSDDFIDAENRNQVLNTDVKYKPPHKINTGQRKNKKTMLSYKIDGEPYDIISPDPNPNLPPSSLPTQRKKYKCDCLDQPYNKTGFSRLQCMCEENGFQTGGWLTF